MQVLLKIGGMSCAGCSSSLEKHLKKQSGIIDASVNLVMNNATIVYENISIETIEKYIEESGFKSLGIDNFKELEQKKNNEKKVLLLLGALSIIALYLTMGDMIGLPVFNKENNSIIYSLLLLLFSIIVVITNFDLFKSGYKNVIHKTPNMDTLISIGVVSAFVYSLWSTILVIMGDNSLVNKLYYESVIIIIFFVKLGRFIDHQSKSKTKEAIKDLMELTPARATIKNNNKEMVVSIDVIKIGDHVICHPGEKIAVDGEVINGSTYINESLVTGESLPVLKEKGSKVIAGSINYNGMIVYEAKRIGKDSTISEIVRMVVEATNTKPPIARLADIISGYFVPIVIIIAFISLLFWLIIENDFTLAFNNFISILVIACPCALGLATPLALVVASGVSAKKGVLIKNTAVLERINKVTTIVFDKTGTLTKGHLVVTDFYNYSKLKDKDLFKVMGSVEGNSEHPIAKAVINYINGKKIKLEEASSFKAEPGYGVEAIYHNQKVIIGNRALMEKNQISIDTNDDEILTKTGASLLYIAIDKRLVGLLGVKDDIKDTAIEGIKRINNKRVIMLTGDNEKTAKIIADQLGIKEVMANVTPQDKANIIKELKKDNVVMMVGDGINDAVSLAVSDVGVSVATGTDIAINSADVILMHDDLTKINDLFVISKKTILNIKENLFWAFFYNIIMIPIAFGLFVKIGIIMNPMLAAMAMILSSLTVVINALRLKKI